MTELSVKLDPMDIAKVKFMLGALSKSGDLVIKQAVNQTLTGVRTDVTNEVSKVITPTKTKIRSTITVNKMTAGDGNAFVKCIGGPLNLINFKARQTQKGVTVQVKKSGGRKLVKHAYITTMKNGNKLVMMRKYDGPRKSLRKSGGSWGAAGRSGGQSFNKGGYGWYAKLPKKYRFPAKSLMSLSIPDVMGHKPTMNEILRLADIRLKKNLDGRLKYELSKLK